MDNWFVVVAYLIVVSFVFAVGLLMLTAPRKSRQFLLWLARADQWSETNRRSQDAPGWGSRFGGLALLLIAIYMALPAFDWIRSEPSTAGSPRIGLPTATNAPADWHSLVVGTLVLLVGLLLLTRPETLLRWGLRAIPHRQVHQQVLQLWVRSIRVMGIAIMMTSLVVLRPWLKVLF